MIGPWRPRTRRAYEALVATVRPVERVTYPPWPSYAKKAEPVKKPVGLWVPGGRRG